MSQTKKFEEVQGNHMVRVYRDSDFQCFIVKCYAGGKIIGDNEQATLEDAIGTAKAELKFMVDRAVIA